MKFLLLLVLLLLPLSNALAADESADFDLSKWQLGGAVLVEAPEGRTEITFEPSDYPNVRFAPKDARDWTNKTLFFETFNPMATPVEFWVRVDDDLKSDGWRGARSAKMTALPGQTQKWILSLGADPMSFGMRALPKLSLAQGGAQVALTQGAAALNLRKIVAWQIFLAHPKEKTSLEVGQLRLVPSPESDLAGLVDEFGQFARSDWPGKIASLAELKSAQAEEERDLALRPELFDRDRFGGWKSGPKFAATGWFRTQKVGDKWWLVTPEGRAFWSTGINVVRPRQPTITTGREPMFAFLPPEGDDLAPFRGVDREILMGPQKGKQADTFDFFAANLARKYGDDAPSKWRQTSLARLRSWGFNTVGNWSEENLRDPKNPARLPYCATVYSWGEFARVPGADDYWGALPDVFDPKWAATVKARVDESTRETKNDPFCLGFFVDNELSWGRPDEANPRLRFSLAIGTLSLSEKSPAKAAFVADLKKKYPTLWALNAAWKTKFKSWAEFGAPLQIKTDLTPAQKTDFSLWQTRFADRYFGTVRTTLKAAAPNHLYLGCRFAWRIPEAVESAARFCDVVSFNIYEKRLDEKEWAFTAKLNKPILIGEWHIGATDRGLLHPGLVEAPNQIERAQMFQSYMESVAKNPAFVGAHWFQWGDEPVSGRSLDGESYAIGFVSIADVPHPELIEAARDANARVYEWHF